MAEVKPALPSYKRVGECKKCGAAVYAPETHPRGEDWPPMSACACRGGPEFADAEDEKHAGRSGGAGRAHAAGLKRGV